MVTPIRLKFERIGPVSYLGHLDVLRYFQKAIQRAGIDIRYSEGFNPHMILSFAYPLGVGMDTYGDYADIEVLSYDTVEDIKNRLNNVMSEGITIVSASVVPEGALNAMASVALADYYIEYESENEISEEKIIDYLSQKEILIQKEGKKGAIKEVDIKPGIIELTKRDKGLFMKLLSGSGINIKPAQITETLGTYLNQNIKITGITRIEIYREEDNEYLPLGEF